MPHIGFYTTQDKADKAELSYAKTFSPRPETEWLINGTDYPSLSRERPFCFGPGGLLR